MTARWIPIRYREFYDVPRAFVTTHEGRTFLFDCTFSEELDEYLAEYAVYRLGDEIRDGIDSISWKGISEGLERVGTIPVAAVVFDATKRASISADVFDLL